MASRFWLLASVGVSILGLASAAQADTLEQALIDAYSNNPQLQAERANLRATDESVPQALSGWRPTVQFTGSVGLQRLENTPPAPPSAPGTATQQPKTVDLNITQPIYQGGATVARTAQAEQLVEAERARSIATENTVFFAVVQAYLDVLRDQAVLELNTNNEQVLRRQREATSEQFRVGSVTRTDVAQSDARLAAATAGRQQAAGNLQVSRASFARAVGHPPQSLAPPSFRPILPATREEALSLASTKNPTVIAAMFTEDSARSAVVATRAQLLPSVNLVGDINRSQESSVNGRETTSSSIVARVTMPLYEAGNIYSQTRQAEETVAFRRGQTDDARRQALQLATQAWETTQSARASTVSLQATVRAAEIALEGVRQEALVGSRTVLDVLNAEQEAFSDRVSLATAQHDLAVAEFNLSQQIGRLTAVDLRLPVQLYDVDAHYKSVRNKWLGFGSKD